MLDICLSNITSGGSYVSFCTVMQVRVKRVSEGSRVPVVNPPHGTEYTHMGVK